jgi:hypothetical protein
MNAPLPFALVALSSLACPLLAGAQPEAAPPPSPSPLEAALQPLELGGYVQARFVWSQASTHDLVRDGFTVRRARLKAQYLTELGGAVLQVDASPRGVTLKDAEVRLMEPWTGRKLELSVGQMKWPFGHEVIQSSQQREFPERSRAIRAFFANERDRGARLTAKVGVVRFSGGVFDGSGIDHRAFLGVDNDRYKDAVGRLGVDLGRFTAGVSGWYGRTVAPLDEGEAGPPAVERTFDRNRVGVDAQLRLGLLALGETTLKVEWIRARSYWRDGTELHGVPAHGGYVLWVQQVHPRHGLALRYDLFDPLLGTSDQAIDAVHTVGVAWVHHWSDAVKLTLAYEVPTTRGRPGVVDPRDNVFTLQLQGSY